MTDPLETESCIDILTSNPPSFLSEETPPQNIDSTLTFDNESLKYIHGNAVPAVLNHESVDIGTVQSLLTDEREESAPQRTDEPMLLTMMNLDNLTAITDSLQTKQQQYFYDTPSIFRRVVRYGSYTNTTLNICPGYLQCNLVVLRKGQLAFDFLLFCQRNPKSCPLIEVCDYKSMHPPKSLAHDDADLRTDIPKYCIYRNGKLSHVVNNVMDYWPEDSVAFLLGTSFTFDYELIQAGVRLKSIEAGLNMPMYQTNIPCRSAGSLSGNMVVSMRPILASQLPKVVEITSKYPHAHGAPVCIGGDPINIGIEDLNQPDWGDPIEIQEDEIPVFHASGVTLQNILWRAGADFSITNHPGYNFVTDLPANGRDYLEHRT